MHPEQRRAPEIDALISALDDLHHRGGWPSYRAIGRAIGSSHTTVSRLFNAHERPSWELVQLVVRHLGGDVNRFQQLWYEAGLVAMHVSDCAAGNGGSMLPETESPRRSVEGELLTTRFDEAVDRHGEGDPFPPKASESLVVLDETSHRPPAPPELSDPVRASRLIIEKPTFVTDEDDEPQEFEAGAVGLPQAWTGRVTAWVTGVCFVATTIVLGSGSLRPSLQVWIGDISQFFWAAVAAAGLLRRAVRERGRMRLTIGLLSTGVGCFAGGTFAWAFQRDYLNTAVPSPSPADIGFYLLPLFAIAALIAHTSSQPRSASKWLPSCALVTFGTLTLLAVVIAVMHHGQIDLSLGEMVSIGYPVTDVVIAWWALNVTRSSLTGFWTIVAMAFIALTLSDTAFLLVRQTHLATVPPGVNLGYIAGPMLLLVAAAAAYVSRPSSLDAATQSRRAEHAAKIAAVGGAASCAAVLVYVLMTGGTHRAMTGSALITAILAIAVLARNFGSGSPTGQRARHPAP